MWEWGNKRKNKNQEIKREQGLWLSQTDRW